ncbi:ATP-binding cassette sub-family B member 5 isoform X2 [Cephus cinctus]|uniref:ATP-binding cassette sub-family B member 5 isoform X2 n=1 Tax=Cephus cinctus TaxID=211228 RepID=A0AAJ7RTG0_CEPCN|nr:ATP-binding cassette sub-family B member 5 isoform X2 [Cephus cinctus]
MGSPNTGKTTCFRLIHRFYDPESGLIFIDGFDVKHRNLHGLRNYVGFVQQCPVLFGTTLEECITCHSSLKSLEYMEIVAKIAGIHSSIIGLTEKYNTPLTEDLPIDQRQKLALARILYRKPQILIMDNALSALTPAAEDAIFESIKSVNKNLTIIVTTRNPLILRKVSKIVYLYDGIAEEYSTVNEIIQTHPEAEKMIGEQKEFFDNKTSTVAKCKYNQKIPQRSMQHASSFLGRSYQELLKTELVRIGRYPVFFQVTDIPTADHIMRKDIKLANTMKLLYYNRKEWLQLLLASVAAAILGFSLPIYAVLFGETLSLIALHNGMQLQVRLNFFTSMFMVAGLVSGICTIIQDYMVNMAGSKLTARMRKYTLKKILHQNLEWFDNETNELNKINTLLKINARKIQQACGQRLIFLIQAITSLTVSIILSMMYSWKLGLAILVFTPIILVVLKYYNTLLLQQSFRNSTQLNKLKLIILESASNIRCIAALTLENAFFERYHEELRKLLVNQKRVYLLAFVHAFCTASPAIVYAVSMFFGGYMLRNREIEIGKVFKVAEAIILGTFMVGHLAVFTPNIIKAQIAAVKLFKIIESPLNNYNRNYKTKLSGNINFNNVSFEHPLYSGLPKLLNFTIQINNGESIALVGCPSSGVSIPIQLLLHFYKPTSGDIFLDGERHENFNDNNLRSLIGLVEGDSIPFKRSIAENIAYGNLKRRIRIDEIVAASKAAYFHDFVMSLPNFFQGYNTVLDETEVSLTISQKVRLSLARALLRNSKILLLENLPRAESPETEMILRKAILSATIDRTCIASSHDPFSAVQLFSRILFMNRGCVEEIGIHEQLMTAQGSYTNFCNKIGHSFVTFNNENELFPEFYTNKNKI